MKNKIIVLCLIVILIFCFSVSVFANQYEYNDVNIYVSNVKRSTIALKTDTVIDFNTPTLTYFDVVLNSSYQIYICMQGGQPINTGITVNGISQVSSGSRTVTFIQSGLIGGVSGQSGSNIWRVQFYTSSTFPAIDLSINGSSVKLSTPVLSFSDNVLSWQPISNAVGYNIHFSSDGTTYTNIVSNTSSNSYTISESGYYGVQAIGQGSYYNSDWSTSLQCEYDSSSSDGGIISWIQSTIQRISASITNFFDNVRTVVNNVGNVFASLTSFLPEEYATLVWSIAGLFLMFGLFRLIF